MFTMTQRLKFAQRLKGQGGFTLLELLVVVAILAIVASGLVVAYDGLEKRAALQGASHGIAGTDDAVRNFTTLRGSAPNNLDSLLAALPIGTGQTTDITVPAVEIATLTSSLKGKIEEKALTAPQRTALANAGITQLRYIDVAGNVTGAGPFPLTTVAADTTVASVGDVSKTDIPNRIFDVPREGANKNRGRGYSNTLAANDTVSVWIADSPAVVLPALPGSNGGINNTKLGAAADDVLIAFGLGNNSTITQVDPTARGDAHLSTVPSYPDAAKNEYSRYVLIYNVGGPTSGDFAKARLQAVVDSKGDFLDEELAEASGQKQ